MGVRLLLVVILLTFTDTARADTTVNLNAYMRLMNGCRAALLQNKNVLGAVVQSVKTIEGICSCASADFFSNLDDAQRQVLGENGLKQAEIDRFLEITMGCVQK